MDEDDPMSSFHLLTDNQRDMEYKNEMMFRRRRNERKPNSQFNLDSHFKCFARIQQELSYV